MAMTTVDARLAYGYALRDAALERIRRLERRGYEVRLRYAGENQMPRIEVYNALHRDGPGLVVTLSRYTDAAAMECAYGMLINELSAMDAPWWGPVPLARVVTKPGCTECGMCLD